ncbi:MAG: LPS export ABC transporter permease LptF [Desulfohalobiaceae bacterium]
MPGFSLIHRLLWRELAVLFLLCLAIFLTLLLLGKMLRLHEVLLGINLSGLDLLQLFFYLSPFFMMLMFPVACMLSMFLAFQRMSADRELMALRAGGVSLAQILPAPLSFLLFCLALNMFISFYGVSWGMHNFEQTMLDLAQNQARVSLQPGSFNKDIPGLIIYARNVQQQTGELEQVFVRDSTDERADLDILAPKGRIATDHEQGKILFTLEDGSLYRRSGEEGDVLNFSSYSLALDLNRLLQGLDVNRDKPKYMGWGELRRLRSSSTGQDVQRTVEVELHKRIALPMACLVLGLMALPLGWICEGLRRQVGAGLILGMFFLYYALFSFGMGLGETGGLAPGIAVWFPNLVFLLLSVWLFYLAHKEAGLSLRWIRDWFFPSKADAE